MRFLVFAIVGLIVLASQVPAMAVEAVVKRVDADRRLLAVTADGQLRTIGVPEGVKVLDVSGRELADGLRAKELHEGARVTLSAQRDGGRPTLREIRLSGGTASSPVTGSVVQQDTRSLIPLSDLGQSKYQGFEGGLYPEGKNVRPAGHESAGIKLAGQVQPLDAAGNPSADGKIVLLGIGFSNTVQAFHGFMEIAENDRAINRKLVLVNGAVGGMSAAMVQDPDDHASGTKYWATVDERLKAASVTRSQVQVVWIKETDPAPHQGGFPTYIRALESELVKIVETLPPRFPNVKLAYLSSRTYGGWAKPRPNGTSPGNSEPFSYETGFAVKWLIQRQLQGDPAISFDPAKGKAPWLSWAAYLWTNGKTPRGDGVFFEYDDFVERDRMHESPAGQRKVGNLLLQFFKSDPTSRPWFVAYP
jgi:hypothetical protein